MNLCVVRFHAWHLSRYKIYPEIAVLFYSLEWKPLKTDIKKGLLSQQIWVPETPQTEYLNFVDH